MEGKKITEYTAEELKALLKNAEEVEKKEKSSKWEKRKTILTKETEKLKKPDLVKMYVELKIKEEKRQEVNEKKKGKSKKSGSTVGKCPARKCIKNEELENTKYCKITGYKFNDFKMCGKKSVEGSRFCEKCHSEAEGFVHKLPRDGVMGEKYSFPLHTLKSQKLWVKMIYELHPEINPEEEKPEEENPPIGEEKIEEEEESGEEEEVEEEEEESGEEEEEEEEKE